MIRGKRGLLTILAIAIVVVLVAVVRLSPLWPGPALPEGATRLRILTAAPHLVPAFACPLALLSPVLVATSGDEMTFVSPESGEAIQIVWPSGWAAWRINGRAEFVDRDGSVIARDGDVIENHFGGGMGDDGRAYVCIIGG
jgi:hypothetical protein